MKPKPLFVFGILLILIGVSIFAYMTIGHYLFIADWCAEDHHFLDKYGSVAAAFWERSGGAISLSILFGGIPTCAGISLLHWKKKL